jgi:hypothetical protein
MTPQDHFHHGKKCVIESLCAPAAESDVSFDLVEWGATRDDFEAGT